MKNRGAKEILRRWLSVEVGVEYKACLYFFVFLFYYCVYLLLHGIYSASLLHMGEMICATYGMGYLQVLVLGNFDESDRYSVRELLLTILCSAAYTGVSYLCGWFDRQPAATAFFALYCAAAYFCANLVNRLKRDADTERLNVMLQGYQRRRKENEECHRDEASDKEIR